MDGALNIQTSVPIISLGSTCAVAYQLQQAGLTQYRYPFDWVKVQKIESVIQSLENRFENYLKFKKEIQTKDTFITFEDDFPENADKINKSLFLKNEDDVQFYHDFTAEKTIDEQLPKVIEKYERRIKRLFETCRSEKVIFVRFEIVLKNLSKIKDLMESIDKNLTTNYLLLVVVYNPDEKILPKIINLSSEQSHKLKIASDAFEFTSWHMHSLKQIIIDNIV